MDFRNDILSHRDRLYRLALSITAHTAEAEDVVQETMLRAWQQRDEWPNIQNLPAWLSQICKRLALDHRKRLDRVKPFPTAPDEGIRAALLQDDHTTSHLEARESAGILQQLINQLPPPQDDLIRLRDIEGLSYHEIALQLNLTDDQVRVYLHRARTRIKEQYIRIQNFNSTQPENSTTKN